MKITRLPLDDIDSLIRRLKYQEYSLTHLSMDVTLPRRLKYLQCSTSNAILELPEFRVAKLTSLKELQLWTGTIPNLDEELSKLTKLTAIYIYTKGMGDICTEAWVEAASKLQEIEELVFISDGHGSEEPCRYVIAPGAFPKLRYLKINNWLMYQPGVMPCLQSIELSVHVRAFNDANFDFLDYYKLRYLCLLEKAHVAIVCWEAKMMDVEEVEATLRRVIQHHPNRPKLILERFGRCADDKVLLEDSYSNGSGSTQRDVDNKQICEKLHHSRAASEVMPLAMLKRITKGFSKKCEVGIGTFGTVYKGVQNNGKPIAVKLLHSMPQRLEFEEEAFRKEFENLRKLNHPNIVELLGYCYETRHQFVEYEGKLVVADVICRALCFEFMHNGSLEEHLDDEYHGLDWHTRYKIIKGTCEGLKYLHEGLESPMYHLDLKPGNILLDMDMAPKIADFGLSKLVYDDQTRATLRPLGTIGYCPPEFIEQNYVSNKFDIFSLGVVMINVIAGSEGHRKTAEMSSQEFIYHVQENWRKRVQIIPGCTLQKHECHQMKRCIEIALDCIHPDRKQRPNIGDIISWLNETEY